MSLLDAVLGPEPPPFALLHHPGAHDDTVEILVGDLTTPATLAGLPLPADASEKVLAVVPYRQIAERGFACPDDGEPLLALTVTDSVRLPLADVLDRLPDQRITLAGAGFETDDEAYAATVREIIDREIGTGEGANFVIKRTWSARIDGYGPATALTVFQRLARRESGAYCTFLLHTGERTFVGATPERHITVRDGVAAMNPISGTYRYPDGGPTLPGVMAFLADRKEADELYMVVDEELKMMARICADGGRVHGPYLKEMARLAHTEYLIEGHTDRDPREILFETMFAPTVTGSPLESAARVIARYEPRGRGYYSGVLAVLGRDERGGHTLDSSILIRTADIDAAGRIRIGVGATLVRHSDPVSEVAETHAKAAALLAALRPAEPDRLHAHPDVREALRRRNETTAAFWFTSGPARLRPVPELAGRRVLVVDAEDTFTSMIGHQLRSLGLDVTVTRFDRPYSLDGHDLVIMGPGPGDPREVTHPKIAHLRAEISALLVRRQPFLAVCLSHQVLSTLLGLPLLRRDTPNQGVQREIELFGRTELVGFYNTFAAAASADVLDVPDVGEVRLSRDALTGEVHALRGPHFASMQFHAESVLTRDGVSLMGRTITGLLAAAVHI